MSSIKGNLRADEHVVYEATIHWFYYVPPTLVILLGLLMTFGRDTFFLGFIFIMFGGIALFLYVLSARCTEIIVTNRKAAFRRGVLNKMSCDLMLDKCDTINIAEPFWGRIFGYGTLIVTTNGINRHRYRYVNAPKQFMATIHNQLEK